MSALRHGDMDALETLFQRHHRRLYGFFVHAAASRAAAEEMTQEVFLRLLRYRRSYRPGSSFISWLYRVCRNVLADRLTELTRERLHGAEPDEQPGREPSPAKSFEDAEAAERLRLALQKLAPTDREVLVLARFQELKHNEIATIVGCSTGAVKVRVHRAMKRLAEVMKTEVLS